MSRRLMWKLLLALGALTTVVVLTGCPDEGGITNAGSRPTPMASSGGGSGAGGAGGAAPPPAAADTGADKGAASAEGAAKGAAAPAASEAGAKEPTEKTETGDGGAAAPAGGAKTAGEGSAAATADTGSAKAPPSSSGAAAGAAGAEEAAAEEKPTTPEEKIENFKNLDPREIIDRKYTDLAEKQTTPWNEEDPDNFIPETGRNDPLTMVLGVVPKELKIPRSGETDQNQIDSYLVAEAASEIANGIAMGIQCHNVIQIGLEKFASFSWGDGGYFTLTQGSGTGPFFAGAVEGIPLVGNITCVEISANQVVLQITVGGSGTPTTITKNQVYIPS